MGATSSWRARRGMAACSRFDCRLTSPNRTQAGPAEKRSNGASPRCRRTFMRCSSRFPLAVSLLSQTPNVGTQPVVEQALGKEEELMAQATEHFLETVDVRDLNELRWPIVRLLAPAFVDRMELRRHKQRLLETGRWERIRAIPCRHSDGKVSTQVFERTALPPWRPTCLSVRRESAYRRSCSVRLRTTPTRVASPTIESPTPRRR